MSLARVNVALAIGTALPLFNNVMRDARWSGCTRRTSLFSKEREEGKGTTSENRVKNSLEIDETKNLYHFAHTPAIGKLIEPTE